MRSFFFLEGSLGTRNFIALPHSEGLLNETLTDQGAEGWSVLSAGLRAPVLTQWGVEALNSSLVIQDELLSY